MNASSAPTVFLFFSLLCTRQMGLFTPYFATLGWPPSSQWSSPSSKQESNEGAVVTMEPQGHAAQRNYKIRRPKATTGEIAIWHFIKASCCRSCGGAKEMEGKVNCRLVGRPPRLPRRGFGGLSCVSGLPKSHNNQSVLLSCLLNSF